MSNEPYDIAILGGGPGGGAAAVQAARRGAHVCLIEAAHLGGTCLNVGCMPTKAMLAASGWAWAARQAGHFGFTPVEPQVNQKAFMARVIDVVVTLRDRVEKGMASHKQIDILRGRGRLTGPNTLSVTIDDGEQVVEAKNIIIATGSRPARPNFVPWDSPRAITTDDAVRLQWLPESILIVGGGVIGCEFATIYSELGIPTAVVEMADNLLPRLDADAGKAAAEQLAERGVNVITGATITAISADEVKISAELASGEKLSAQTALIAVGRTPNIDDIGLDAAGVETRDGIIPVDDRCRTNIAGIYAVGDTADQQQYAHLAERMGLVAADNALGHDAADDRTVVPAGVYTHPEIAAVGQTLEQAKTACPDARVLRYAYRNSGTALAYVEMEGQLKIVADGETGKILGGLWIGPHAVDLIEEVAVAMRHGLTLADLHRTIHPHPSFQEAMAVIAETWTAQAMRKQR